MRRLLATLALLGGIPAGLPPCTCRHVGQCPFRAGPDLVDGDDQPLLRELTPEERANAWHMADGKEHGDPIQRGDLAGTDEQGNAMVIARALDPDRARDYAQSKVETRCQADSPLWCESHPRPDDL